MTAMGHLAGNLEYVPSKDGPKGRPATTSFYRNWTKNTETSTIQHVSEQWISLTPPLAPPLAPPFGPRGDHRFLPASPSPLGTPLLRVPRLC